MQPSHSELIVLFKEALEKIKADSEHMLAHSLEIVGNPYTGTCHIKKGEGNVLKIMPGLFREKGGNTWMIRCHVFHSGIEHSAEKVLRVLAKKANAGLLLVKEYNEKTL